MAAGATRPGQGGRGPRADRNWFTSCGGSEAPYTEARRRGRERRGPAASVASRGDNECEAGNATRTSPAPLWSAAGRKPSARPFRNWAVRCRIPILCRAESRGVAKAAKHLPQHVGIIGFLQTAKCCRTASGLPQLGHKLMRRERQSEHDDEKQARPASARQAHQLVDPRRRSGRTPALPYPPPETKPL